VRLAQAVEFPGYNGLQIPPDGTGCEMPVKSEGQLR
jgi:hypothetical protein